MITKAGLILSLGQGRAAHYKNLKPHVPSLEHGAYHRTQQGLEYLLVKPECEINEESTRGRMMATRT